MKKLYILSASTVFFLGIGVQAQKKKSDTTKTKDIDEVVVLGYNRKSTKTKDVSATTMVTSETLANRPNASFLNSLQGAAPGLSINSNSGSPGSGKIDMVIRGVSSINASTDPLIVIDGIISNANQFRNINAEDIASVSVLKDAAATSIYGNRGANGVLMVTTKTGKFRSSFALSYSGNTGVSFGLNNKYNMSTSPELLTIQKRLGIASALKLTDEQISNTPTTEWEKVFFKPSMTQSHNISATFGSETVNSYTSLGYFEQGGMVPGTQFQRFSLRNNINGKTKNERFTFSSNIGISYSKRRQLSQEDNSNLDNQTLQNPLLGATMGNPTLRPGQFVNGYDLYNAIGRNYANGNNIYVLENTLNQNNIGNRINDLNIFASITGTLKLTDNWTVTNKSGIDFKQTNGLSYSAPWSFIGGVVTSVSSATTITPNPYGGSESITNGFDLGFNSVTSTNYKLQLGEKHTFNFGLYLDYLKDHYNYSSRTQNGLDPKVWQPGNGRGYIAVSNITGDQLRYVPSVSANKITAGTLSYFGTLDYDYADKYGFSGVLRRDGSYRFVGDNKWGTFWSVAGRWNINKEPFMKDMDIQLLKLRTSYGTMGNQNIVSPAAGSNALLVSPALARDLVVSNTGYNNVPGYNYTIGNPTLMWEELSQFNVGLDFALFKNKLEGNFDYYEKKTDKMYLSRRASAVNGFYTYNGNEGGMKNSGFELLLRYNVIRKKDVSLSVWANGSYNKNRLLSIVSPVTTGSRVRMVGRTIYEWNMVPYLGVNPENGKMQYLDINGNVTETPTENDRRLTGKSILPKYQGGFGLSAEYKGFFLDATFTFQASIWKYDNMLSWMTLPSYAAAGHNVSSDLLRAWTPDNRNTDIPALNTLDYGSLSDRLLYDSSFIKFRNLQIGYSIPKEMLKDRFVKSLKVFIQGENLAVWSKWRGWDPEGITASALSIYPNPRTFTIGTNIEF
ncbi:SusC/RagA family TonB-linked outer membrane protein [Elizabethkingia sp. 2-6]|uniref:SusC/RagA family TonB-linked outer membrane protein n=1 Tax=Elizabethkingia sp. 2-6 TaxID=2575699 RepID=UPI0010C1A9BA|nr:SusC/RagA family TonB-linked outer membrane protein [Elizabethkingia sp. 2-6]QCO47800.1 SusC/RagA family TonB-linked outer membrane protein [Elizabethkingia sp. 2-6]